MTSKASKSKAEADTEEVEPVEPDTEEEVPEEEIIETPPDDTSEALAPDLEQVDPNARPDPIEHFPIIRAGAWVIPKVDDAVPEEVQGKLCAVVNGETYICYCLASPSAQGHEAQVPESELLVAERGQGGTFTITVGDVDQWSSQGRNELAAYG